MSGDPAGYIPASKLPAIDAAVRASCDAADGVVDGVINDPRQRRFKPASLICKDAGERLVLDDQAGAYS